MDSRVPDVQTPSFLSLYMIVLTISALLLSCCYGVVAVVVLSLNVDDQLDLLALYALLDLASSSLIAANTKEKRRE